MEKLQILVIALLFISCNSKTEKNSETINQNNSLQKVTEIGAEKLYPIKKATEKFDTLIVGKQIRISIVRKDLDSYVLHKSLEFRQDIYRKISKRRNYFNNKAK